MTATALPGDAMPIVPLPLPKPAPAGSSAHDATTHTRWLATDVLRSEWTRLRTIRSTYWTLLAAAGAVIGLSAVVCAVYLAQYAKLSPQNKATFDPISVSLVGAGLAQLAIAVLGVLIITNEYSSGMIRSTFAAVPQRLGILAAKAAVFATVTFVVTTTASFIAFFVGQAILSGKHLGVSISAPGALQSIIGTGLYLSVLGLLSLGLGTLIRKTAGAISAVFAILFIVPVIVSLLPGSMSSIQKYLPSNAGQEIVFGASRVARRSTSDVLSPWVGFSVFCLYATAALVISGWTLVHRDA